MKFVVSILLLLALLCCNPTREIHSEYIYAHYEDTVLQRGVRTWHIYNGEKYTAFVDHYAGENIILLIPHARQGRTYQFKPIEVTATRRSYDGDEVILSTSDGVLFRVKSVAPVGTKFIVWTPR